MADSTEHVLRVTDRTGDTETKWRTDDPMTVERANRIFDQLREKGYLGYTVPVDGSDGDVLHSFDPEAREVVMTPPLVGG